MVDELLTQKTHSGGVGELRWVGGTQWGLCWAALPSCQPAMVGPRETDCMWIPNPIFLQVGSSYYKRDQGNLGNTPPRSTVLFKWQPGGKAKRRGVPEVAAELHPVLALHQCAGYGHPLESQYQNW